MESKYPVYLPGLHAQLYRPQVLSSTTAPAMECNSFNRGAGVGRKGNALIKGTITRVFFSLSILQHWRIGVDVAVSLRPSERHARQLEVHTSRGHCSPTSYRDAQYSTSLGSVFFCFFFSFSLLLSSSFFFFSLSSSCCPAQKPN